uniref:Auxin-responsive protein n=1 Tax=Anthurium amnicola TaxID=1678845 RepID=A0A1D1Y2T2_9ARAE
MFETEESGTRRYMGTITGISDLDPVRWKNSKWRNLQVGWDESAAGERRNRVSMWEIEPVQAPFFICPPPFFRSKRPRQPGMPDDESVDMENFFKRAMPWLGDEICIKDSSSQNAVIPGLSLLQWMNMQNPSLSNSAIQPDYLRSLAGPVVQNYSAADLSKQLGLQAQILQQNNIQFNTPRPLQQTQQVDQLSKLTIPSNQPGIVTIPPQQIRDINQQQRQQLVVNQTLPSNQNQNLLHPQILIQNQVQQQQLPIQNNQPAQTCSPLNQPQQQLQQQPQQQQVPQLHQPVQQQLQQQQQQEQSLVLQQQQLQSRMSTQLIHHANQQMQLSEQQIQLQALHKLQQQQPLLAQPTFQQPQQAPEQQKTLLEITHHLSNMHSLPQQQINNPQTTKNAAVSIQFSQSLQHHPQQKLQPTQVIQNEITGSIHPQPSINIPSTAGSCLLTSGVTRSVITEDVPSCSTSPSTNSCPVIPQGIMNKAHTVTMEVSQPAVTILSPGSFEAFAGSTNVAKVLQKPEIKASVPVPKSQNHQATFAPQSYISNTAQLDYLDASSSATSVCLSQTDTQLQHNLPLSSFNQQSLFFRDGMQESQVPCSDPRNSFLFGVNIDSPLGIPMPSDPLLTKSISTGKDYQNNLTSDNIIPNYGGFKDAQAELSTSIVSQSFGVPDVAFNSIDSTINDNSILNKCSWAPPPQFQRMRTYTKVYKRGAVGRSIDITRYSGYDELKQDLARMFSIEGQLEDRQRMGWKLVYVDHERDVLLVGDDPWEEFVNCVRCIRILSPQEVQQMSLDGDIGGNNILSNQACSSSDGGNAWRGQCDQNSNPSAGSYGHID